MERRGPPPRSSRPVPFHRTREGYAVSTDTRYLDVPLIHRFLTGSYWAEGVPLEVVQRSIASSIGFGLYQGDPLVGTAKQVGFARIVTDRATFAWLCDVFVLDEHRGNDLGKWLVETVLEHPDLVGLRTILLATRDAHGLYERFGFEPVPEGRFMAIRRSHRA
jgi:GNAT superfamily N-acetyltransferase